MMNIILFGQPASGKGTMATLIKKEFKLNHISTGDLIRKEIKAQTTLGKKAQKIMSGGNLLTDELVIKILKSALKANKNKRGILFDGFPRTKEQSKMLYELMQKNKTPINVLFHISVSDEVSMQRIQARGVRPGEDPNDIIAHNKHRLEVYKEKTIPALIFFVNKIDVVQVNGNVSIPQVYRQIQEYLKK